MFVINDDLSIYCTRGDALSFPVDHSFKANDIVRMQVFKKKNCAELVLRKDFTIEEATERFEIELIGSETKFGDIISKPVDFWYEVEVNPGEHSETIIGYDEDGAKVFKLFPEGQDGIVTYEEFVDSAYKIAVAHGFEGTEEEWLVSLKGEQGVQGSQGVQGIKGEKGDKGDKGDTGASGANGTPATHVWNGTVLTITSASGTSSSDLKGAKGDKGDKGDKGADGTMTFSELTEEQKASLKGDKGDKGDKGEQGERGIQGEKGDKGDKGDKGNTGNSGVYLGSGAMPSDCNVQIDPNGDAFTIEQLLEMLSVKPGRISTATLLADKWVGTQSPYSQVVTIDGATERSQVDLTPSVEQLAVFYNKDLAFVTENEDGVITVYAIGQKPENDYTIQVTLTEVDI